MRYFKTTSFNYCAPWQVTHLRQLVTLSWVEMALCRKVDEQMSKSARGELHSGLRHQLRSRPSASNPPHILVSPSTLPLSFSFPLPLSFIPSLMFPRLSQLARHFSRPLPNYAHNSAASIANRGLGVMASFTADERNSRTIHTAACLIIGDEVLGGKVCVARRFQGGMG